MTEQFQPRKPENFAELTREFEACLTADALRFRVLFYTLGSDVSRDDIMDALSCVEKQRGWRIE